MPCPALLCEQSSEQRPSSPTTTRTQVLNSGMEPAGAASELSWSTFNSGMAAEESELMAQLLGCYPFSNEQDHDPSLVMQSLFWSDHSVDSYHGTQDANTNMYYLPLENSCTLSACNYYNKQTSLVHESYYNTMESDMLSTIGMRCLEEENITAPSIQDNHVNGKISMRDWKEQSREDVGALVIHGVQNSKGKRKIRDGEPVVDVDRRASPAASPKKKARASPQPRKSAKDAKSKEDSDAKVVEEEVGTPVKQCTSCYSSEDDSNHSHEPNGGGATRSSSKGSDEKTRAGRGSATDPQSLYARKRRERINERLRVLQNLVPNGTKVDISTMLEEAVQYVKFLQLQIKLLSSDELWMYAPIAYYGMNIGINLNISEP